MPDKNEIKEEKKPIQEILEKLESGIHSLMESDKYKAYLKCMSKFHNYSFNNTILIAMQMPEATFVAGYKSWEKKFKRQVKKGEKGIRIIAPAPIKKKVNKELVGLDGNAIIGLDGKAITEAVEITVPSFKVVSVFDVSQTDGRELPIIEAEELKGNVDKYKDYIEALEHISPVPIKYGPIETGAKGYFSPSEQSICVKEGMSQVQTLKTLIHEISHSLLHDINHQRVKELPDSPIKDRNTKEVEAESVAYTVCQALGKGSIDTKEYSFAYIASWSSGKELKELKDSLETIRITADKIISGVEDYMYARDLQKEAIKEMAENIADEINITFKEKLKEAKEELKHGERSRKPSSRSKDSDEIHSSRAKHHMYL